MGNCASSSQEAEGKARSDMIDRQIEEDSKKYKRECKILLLGACATPVFCHSEGNGEGKKLCLRECSRPIPFLHDGCQRRVWRSFARHGTPPHLSLACHNRRRTTRHAPLRYGCLHIHTSWPFLLTCSCFDAEHRISVYALTHTHTVAFRQVPASPESRR
jgi:hypothetical protein